MAMQQESRNMTPSEAASILRKFNEWRRNPADGWRSDPSTKEITDAIDAAVALLAGLEAEQQPRTFDIPAASISLKAGERYAGIVLGQDDEPSYHLILLPGAAKGVAHALALKWAKVRGGELPNRREQALLYANLKSEFTETWYWSSVYHESDRDYAWFQHFGNGSQECDYLENKLRARAVRREYFMMTQEIKNAS